MARRDIGKLAAASVSCALMSIRILPLILFALSACAFTSAEPVQLPTATTVRVVPATLVPTVNRQAHVIPSIQPDNTETPTPVTDCAGDDTLAPVHYAAVVNLNYTQRALVARQTVRYVNRTADALPELVLNVEANQWPGAFTAEAVQVAGDAAVYEITGRRMSVELPEALETGCAQELEISFQLNVPQIGEGISAFKGFLGHTPRQLNLSNWLLTVAPYLNGDWVIRDASLIGEQTVAEVADWDVTLNISGAGESLQIAAPGEVRQTGARNWHIAVQHSRDFAVSLSDAFAVASAETESGVTVEVYTYPDAQVVGENGNTLDGAAYALEVAVESLKMFEDLFGAYPHSRLVVVEGDFPDGMEFSGIVFVSRDWFTRWPGNPASYLMLITVHEVAHQWWYAGVGSDQALAPWLDEALATYSEYVFIEEYYPELKDWWWAFRVDNYSPEGFVDSAVYEFSSIREYINAVYLLGARMLHELRGDLGTDAFFALLRAYAEAGHGQIVSPDLLWSLMTQEQLQATQATRQKYLRQPGLSG